MERGKFGMVNLDTGEVFEDAALALIFPKQRNGFDGWVAMAQGALMALAKANLGDEARRVLFAVLAKLNFENWIQLDQSELATEIGIRRSNFSRAIRKLEDEGVLLRGPKVGRSVTYRLNPDYGWKGSAKGHRQALQEQLQERMRAAGLSVINSSRED